jgi:hypothetical protein
MKKTLLLSVLAIGLLTSCSKEELTSNGLPANVTCEEAFTNYQNELAYPKKSREEMIEVYKKYKTAYPQCNIPLFFDSCDYAKATDNWVWVDGIKYDSIVFFSTKSSNSTESFNITCFQKGNIGDYVGIALSYNPFTKKFGVFTPWVRKVYSNGTYKSYQLKDFDQGSYQNAKVDSSCNSNIFTIDGIVNLKPSISTNPYIDISMKITCTR